MLRIPRTEGKQITKKKLNQPGQNSALSETESKSASLLKERVFAGSQDDWQDEDHAVSIFF